MTVRSRFKVILISILMISSVTTILHFSQSSQSQKNKITLSEDIVCIAAICLQTGVGDECFDTPANLSKISLVKDANTVGAYRIIIEPTPKSCGGLSGIF
jgi:hypothetical protein